MISAVGAKMSSKKLITRSTDWDAFKDAASNEITAATKGEELLTTMSHCLKACKCLSTKNDRFSSNDEEFEKLCAIRRRAGRKALRTKCLKDLRACRRTQCHIRRYLDKRSWQRWHDFCSTLDVHQPIAKVWWVFRGMQTPLQQLHLFTVLSLHERKHLKELSEGYCTLLSLTSNPGALPQTTNLISHERQCQHWICHSQLKN